MVRVKLQLSYALSRNAWPSRVLIRILSTDVAEVCVDADGSCWMGFLRQEWRCYETLEYILNYLGLSARMHLGSVEEFRRRAARPGLLAWNMSPKAIFGVCNAACAMGWPCVVNRASQRMRDRHGKKTVS